MQNSDLSDSGNWGAGYGRRVLQGVGDSQQPRGALPSSLVTREVTFGDDENPSFLCSLTLAALLHMPSRAHCDANFSDLAICDEEIGLHPKMVFLAWEIPCVSQTLRTDG